MPSQKGRIFLVTGGTSGMGFEDAKALAAAGARVIIAARNAERGQEAIDRIRQDIPAAQVQFERLDLSSLSSVRDLGRRLGASLPRLDGLINNAAIMATPERATSVDGLEMQFATNYAGHFVLTAELLPLLRKSDAPRVVTLSSIAVHRGTLNLDDLQSTGAYEPMTTYAQSKLACLMFAFELQRRSDAAGWGIRSLAAHPGISRTDLLPNGAGANSLPALARRYLWFLFQPAEQGALPPLFAATASTATPGAYYGPDRLGETRGHPALAKVPTQAEDLEVAERLWRASERLTGVVFGDAEAQRRNR